MEIATVLNAHSRPDVVLDTLDSIQTYVSDKVVVLVDGVSWESFKDLPAVKLEGFRHGVPKSPYRNVALGLKTISESWPSADWYCYTEYDVLFCSDRFRHNLKMADDLGVWMLGNDGHVDSVAMPMVQALIGEKFRSAYYLLGCCQFFHKDFMAKLRSIDFFDRFLSMTNGFSEGYMPFYSGYDLSEHMYPTLCRHFGGKVGVFATYDQNGEWHGSYRHFPVRWRPELDPETEDFPEASIMHPLKDIGHPIRAAHRDRRKAWKDSQQRASRSG